MTTRTRRYAAKQRFVLDTTTLISYFASLFNQPAQISKPTLAIISRALQFDRDILLIVPSVVFVEIFDKWFHGNKNQNEEFRARFRAEVFEPIRNAPNIEIRTMDAEVLEMFLRLDDPDINLENHDRIILASAAVLESPLITSGREIIRYNTKHKVISSVIS